MTSVALVFQATLRSAPLSTVRRAGRHQQDPFGAVARRRRLRHGGEGEVRRDEVGGPRGTAGVTPGGSSKQLEEIRDVSSVPSHSLKQLAVELSGL